MSDVAEFWRWFAANEHGYRDLEVPHKEGLLNELEAALHSYNADLWFEVGNSPDGPHELIISAEGRRSLFGAVRALVSGAPPLSNWKVIAFKPAQGFDFVTRYKDITVSPEVAWFKVLDTVQPSYGIDIRVVFAQFDESRRTQFETATLLMIDAGLGELAAAEIIHVAEVGVAPSNPEAAGYRVLDTLPAVLAERGYQVGT